MGGIFCFLRLFVGWLERDGLFGPELEFAVFVNFGLGLYAGRDLDHVFEDSLAGFIDRLGAIDYTARRQIEIVRHAFEHGSV